MMRLAVERYAGARCVGMRLLSTFAPATTVRPIVEPRLSPPSRSPIAGGAGGTGKGALLSAAAPAPLPGVAPEATAIGQRGDCTAASGVYTPLTISGNHFDTAAESLLRAAARIHRFTSPFWVSTHDLSLLGLKYARNAFRIAVPVKGTSGRSVVLINGDSCDNPRIFTTELCARFGLPLDVHGDRFPHAVSKALMAAAKVRNWSSPYWMTRKQLGKFAASVASVHSPGAGPGGARQGVALLESAEGVSVGLETFFNAQETTHPSAFSPVSCTNKQPRCLNGSGFAHMPPSFLHHLRSVAQRHHNPSPIWITTAEVGQLGGTIKDGAVGVAHTPSSCAAAAADPFLSFDGEAAADALVPSPTLPLPPPPPRPLLYYNANDTTIAEVIEATMIERWSTAQAMMAAGFVPVNGRGRRFASAVQQCMLCGFAKQEQLAIPIFVTENVIRMCGSSLKGHAKGIALPGQENAPFYGVEQCVDPARVQFCARYSPHHVGTRQAIHAAHAFAMGQIAYDRGLQSIYWVPLHLLEVAGVTAALSAARYRVASTIIPDEVLVPGSGTLVNADETSAPEVVAAMARYSPSAPSGFQFGNRLLQTSLMRAVAAREGYQSTMWATTVTIERAGTALRKDLPQPLPMVKDYRGFGLFNLEATQEPRKLREFAALLRHRPTTERLEADGHRDGACASGAGRLADCDDPESASEDFVKGSHGSGAALDECFDLPPHGEATLPDSDLSSSSEPM